MKTYFILLLLVAFCWAFVIVTYLLSEYKFERWQISLMTHVPLMLFSGGVFLSEHVGKNSIHDRKFQLVGKWIIFVFLFLYCLNSAGLVTSVTGKLFWFYGINLVGLLMIFISTLRHGNFRD